jgi:glycosyltransferase involved in cell wall biosynthesis
MNTIYLVNPVSGRGHLDSYARLYSRALIELGYKVVLVAETDGGTLAYLERNCAGLRQAFSFAPFEEPGRYGPLTGMAVIAHTMRRVWRDEGIPGLLVRCVRIPRRFLLSYASPRFQSTVIGLEREVARRVLSSRLGQWLNLARYFDGRRMSFVTLRRYVDTAVKMPGRSAPDLILFLYLDLMAERSRHIAALDRAGGWPWTGILFHPRKNRERSSPPEAYFNSRNARGAVFLVPAAIPVYTAAIPQLHFALTPDVADLELPAKPAGIADEIRRLARGRVVVLQIGSITAHKGIPTLLDVIEAADPNRFFFALVGEVHWESFAENERRVRHSFAQPSENVFVHQGYMASETDYNSLMAACDIVYAVYQGFNSSSNSLTKAAGLGRPILVAANCLMGERVLASGIGAVAPEGDTSGILAELNRLADQPKDRFSFEQYRKQHSLEELKSVLAEALPRWLAKPAEPEMSAPSRTDKR